MIASVYNGDLQQIKNIIENPEINIWSRNAALKSLLVLIKGKILDRNEVVNYLRTLFYSKSFADNNKGAMKKQVGNQTSVFRTKSKSC